MFKLFENCYCVSQMFNSCFSFLTATLATTFGVVLWLLSYYSLSVPLEARYRTLSLRDKLLAALVPNMGLHWVIKVMCGFEGKGKLDHDLVHLDIEITRVLRLPSTIRIPVWDMKQRDFNCVDCGCI